MLQACAGRPVGTLHTTNTTRGPTEGALNGYAACMRLQASSSWFAPLQLGQALWCGAHHNEQRSPDHLSLRRASTAEAACCLPSPPALRCTVHQAHIFEGKKVGQVGPWLTRATKAFREPLCTLIHGLPSPAFKRAKLLRDHEVGQAGPYQ